MVTLSDISLKEFQLENLPLIEKLRTIHFKTQTEVCIERAELITDFLSQKSFSNDNFQIIRAKAIHHYLSKRKVFFHDDNLLGGSTTSKDI